MFTMLLLFPQLIFLIALSYYSIVYYSFFYMVTVLDIFFRNLSVADYFCAHYVFS